MPSRSFPGIECAWGSNQVNITKVRADTSSGSSEVRLTIEATVSANVPGGAFLVPTGQPRSFQASPGKLDRVDVQRNRISARYLHPSANTMHEDRGATVEIDLAVAWSAGGGPTAQMVPFVIRLAFRFYHGKIYGADD